MHERGSNHQLLKQSNYNLIKKYIYQHSPVSRVEVAQALSLTTPTITGMVNPLIARGLLQEIAGNTAEEEKSAGRPRIMLEFVPDAYYICGVDVGPYWINYVLTDLHGNVISSHRTDDTLGEYEKTAALLCRKIPEFLQEAGVSMKELLGVGLCLPGLINGSADKIYTTFQNGWTERDICKELGQRLGTQVVVENNVRARAIRAELFDRSVTAEPFAYFFVSFGVACQMIIGGKVLYGQSAAAGEIGHTVVQRGGAVCPTCGNRGCLEALAGERAVLQRCRQEMAAGNARILAELCSDPRQLTIDQVLQAQEMGDRDVHALMEDVLDYLGIALANTINTISPREVIVDGHMLDSHHNQQLLLRSAERNIFRVHADQIRFRFQPYDPFGGARGAAAVVVREMLLHSSL